ncbi:MAG: LytTR family DNA-binding domain-containing protein [Puia sp.]|nr:LytTR family DNA-binding domain-containing protein [Puia sp.]
MAEFTKYNCVIVDDDEIDRLTTLSFVRKYPQINVCGVCSSVDEALKIIETGDINILFSDIDMPGTDGFEFRRRLMHIPVCIFVTSFADMAAESFELSALDFLVKPIKGDRFERTVARIHEYIDIRKKAALYEYSLGGDAVFIKDGHSFIKVKLHEILYIEALKDYTLLFTAEKKYCVLSPIGSLLKEDNFRSFIRVHRSYAVQKHLIAKISSNKLIINNITIPIGRMYKDNLLDIKS